MDNINITLNILLDSLENKYDYFKQIYEITKNQARILKTKDVTKEFEATINEKQEILDKVIRLDEGFQLAFKRIKDELHKNSKKYKDSIIKLQQYITKIMELSIKIEILEQKNEKRIKNNVVISNKSNYTQSKNNAINSYTKTKQLFKKQ